MNPQTLIRFFKFAMVGGSGVFVNLGIYFVLTRFLGLLDDFWLRSFSYAFSVEVSIITNFLLNDWWTFADRKSSGVWWTRFLRFHVVSLVGFAINWGCFFLINYFIEQGDIELLGTVNILGSARNLDDMIAAVIGIGAAMLWNFSANLLWTWGRPGTSKDVSGQAAD